MSRARLGTAITVLVTIVALAALQWRHVRERERFAAATAAIDNATQARLHLLRAYLIRTRIDAGDPAFRAVDASASVDRARLHLRDWLEGREGGVGVRAVPALRDTALRRMVAALDADLSGFERALRAPATGTAQVDLRILQGVANARADSIQTRADRLIAESTARTERNQVLAMAALAALLLGAGLTLARAAGREERAARRTRQLRALAEALAAARTPEEVASAARAAGNALLGTSMGASALIAPHGGGLVVIESTGLAPGALEPGTVLPETALLPIGHTMQSGAISVLDRPQVASTDPAVLRALDASGVATTVAVPLIERTDGGPRTIGVLTFHSAEPRTFSLGALTFIEGLAHVTSQAMARAVAARAEQAARAAAQAERERLTEVLERIPVGVIVLDGSGRVVHRNQAVGALLDRPTPALEAEVVAAPVGAVHDDGRPYAPHEYPMARALRAGTRVDAEVTRYRRGDGSEVLLAISAVPLAREGEPPRGAVGTIFDVTALRRAEEAREESERRFEVMAERLPLGIFRNDADGRVQYVNPRCEEIFGVSEGELLQHGWSRRVHPDDQARIWREREATRGSTAARHRYDLRIVRGTDGAVREILLDAVYARDAQGRVTASFGVVEDITERRSLEAQLRQAQKMEAVGRLAGGVAHDFNNLLTVISGVTELLLADPGMGPAQLADLREVHDAARRASDLTRQLLAFSRQQSVRPAPTDLNGVVTRTHHLLRRLLGEHIAIELELARGLPAAHADTGAVDQILMNLAVNAKDAMPSGGRLVVRTRLEAPDPMNADPARRAPRGYVVVEMQDTGVGMDDSVLAHIFEPFFTTKEAGRGTGLGLAMVYGLVQQMRGFVRAESTLGAGTTIGVHLPVALEAAQAADGVAAHPAMPRGQERILLVEDDEALRRLVKRTLGDLGYTVLEASSAGAALVLAAAEDALAMLLTDVILPGRPGSQLAEEVRALHPGIRVLFTSGYSSDELLHRQLEAGAPLLAKPFSMDLLAQKVREVLDAPPAA